MRADASRGAIADEPTRWLPCANRPVLALPSRAGTLILDECGAALFLSDGEPAGLMRVDDVDNFAVAIGTRGGGLAVGLYSAMLACRDQGPGGFTFRAVRSPVLALAETPEGTVSGDAAGMVALLDAS